MIEVVNRELLIPREEYNIGTCYDNNTETRQFHLKRVTSGGVDLAALTFNLDIQYANRQTDAASLVKEVTDKDINLVLTINNSMLQVPGTVLIQIRALDEDGVCKWTSYKSAFFVEDHINTPGHYEGDLTQLEQYEAEWGKVRDNVNQLNLRMDEVVRIREESPATEVEEEVVDARVGADNVVYDSLGSAIRNQVANEKDARITAVSEEASARANAITTEATARQTADNTLLGNINSEAATRASADSNLQTQINQIIAPSGEAPSAAEVQNARIGADGVTYDTLGNAIRGQVTDLKSALGSLLDNSSAYLTDWTQGYIRADGTDGDSKNKCRESEFHQFGEFSTVPGVTFTVKNGYKIQFNEYTSASVGSFTGRVTNDYKSGMFTLSLNPDRYYRATIQKTDESNFTFRDIPSDVLLAVHGATNKTLNLSNKLADSKAVGDNLRSINDRFIINLFDKDSPECVTDAYLNVYNGQTVALDGCIVSDYIDISAYNDIKVSYTHIVCFYGADKTFLGCPSSMDSRGADLSLAIPSDVKYVRFSTFSQGIDKAQLGPNVSRDAYMIYGRFLMPGLISADTQVQVIVVDITGNGDYTSLTKALKDNVDKHINIMVMPGTYNLVAEYNAIWGTSAVDNMSDSDYNVFDGFQFGIIIRNKKIQFMPGAKVICDWHYKSDGVTERTVNGTHRFSPIRVDYDAEIIGLHLVCNHTFYAVHDDYGLMDTPYTIQYKDCVIEAESLRQQNVIGGGCKKYSRHTIENCYFSNGEHSNIHTVRYHNTNQADAVPEIFVSNTYFNGTFTARWYGTQTTKMRVYVNNCKARAIYTMQEATGYDEENVTLYKWNNEETDPVA